MRISADVKAETCLQEAIELVQQLEEKATEAWNWGGFPNERLRTLYAYTQDLKGDLEGQLINSQDRRAA